MLVTADVSEDQWHARVTYGRPSWWRTHVTCWLWSSPTTRTSTSATPCPWGTPSGASSHSGPAIFHYMGKIFCDYLLRFFFHFVDHLKFVFVIFYQNTPLFFALSFAYSHNLMKSFSVFFIFMKYDSYHILQVSLRHVLVRFRRNQPLPTGREDSCEGLLLEFVTLRITN